MGKQLIAAVSTGVFVWLFLTMLVFWACGSEMKDLKEEAIKHHAAHYDAQSGAFTWNDEGKK